MGGRHRTTRPHAVAQRIGPGLYWLPFQRGYDRCRITVHRESPRPRPAASSENLIHALAWFGTTMARGPCHARLLFRRQKLVAEFPRHEFERSGVAGGLNDAHERFYAEFRAGVAGIGFPEQGRVFFVHGLGDVLGGHLASRHDFVDGLDDFVHMFVLKKPDDSGFDCIS